ncbi:TolC family protein [Mongoliibacter ruber]|uniref:NodT family efflux transporter outer membrane factor (OMF) lipoprotein n=1 Tax=Mongoliibacter ruber TaxID=1750599 RepID=A0A2T0WG82_9BACT|nr:TolC family protein [Mongoliibacter ruber]PRY85717.1 NodT family efflux transporter outer membrane factor (OMF) lipoprotein [Mongoliibacter ruber]
MRIVYQSKILLGGLMVCLLFSCKVSEIPSVQLEDLPEKYEVDSSEEVSQSSVASINWENYFDDPHLKALIQIALENNQDNLKTLEKIKIARANLGIARGGLLPEIDGIAGAMSRRFGEYTMDGVGNTDSNLSPTVPEDKLIPDPYRDFIIGAQFSWEIDVWGKLKNRKRAAFERYLASEEMANYIKTWLIGEVVTHYYQLIALDEELRILESNIALQENAVNLSKDLKESGKENQLAVDQFEALMLNSKALLIERQRQLRTTELHLTRLLGKYAMEHQRTTLDDTFDASELAELGLPAELLRNRPDIRIAERELIASKADVNAARAAFFPSLNLYGMAGYNAFDFGKLFFSPASMVYQIGAGLTAPIFNRNRIRMEMETAKASQKIAYLDYEQTVFKSYLEILNLINEFKTYDEQLQLKSYEVEVQKRSVENSNVMFRVGYADYLEVLNAQSRALQSEIELIAIKKEQLQTNVRLYVALGGGWM